MNEVGKWDKEELERKVQDPPNCEAGSGAWALSDVGWYRAQHGTGVFVPGERCHVGLSVWTQAPSLADWPFFVLTVMDSSAHDADEGSYLGAVCLAFL